MVNFSSPGGDNYIQNLIPPFSSSRFATFTRTKFLWQEFVYAEWATCASAFSRENMCNILLSCPFTRKENGNLTSVLGFLSIIAIILQCKTTHPAPKIEYLQSPDIQTQPRHVLISNFIIVKKIYKTKPCYNLTCLYYIYS